jgi:hypothetical protein
VPSEALPPSARAVKGAGPASPVPVLARRSWHAARSALGAHPGVFLPWARRHYGPELAFGPGTEIVIEGFPRSGNTFAVVAFEAAQTRPFRIAHHLHAPAQVIAGVQAGKPVLVLVRHPEESALSLVIREPHLTLAMALRDYRSFYEKIWSHRDGIVVASFPEVTTDFGAVVRRVNDRFGTVFEEFAHTPENVQRCFEVMGEINRLGARAPRDAETGDARPSPDRELRKLELRGALERVPEEVRLRAIQIHEAFARLGPR